MFIADSMNHCIRGTNNFGEIRTVAGGPQQGDDGDGEGYYDGDGEGDGGDGEGDDGDGEGDGGDGGGYDGDGEAAGLAALNNPIAVSILDADGGTLFVLDAGNVRVRRVVSALETQAGPISTVAGCGSEGYSGDGGLATEAQLREPQDVLLNPDGDLLILDAGNHRIRSVSW